MFALLSTIALKAQVTIGDLNPPHPSSVLQVVSTTDYKKGVLVPEMTEGQRDSIQSPADGLLIYNTGENCFNYYSASGAEWKSMCGGLAKATFTISDCSAIVVHGSYTENNVVNASDYLTVTADVTKAGNYSFSATTTNGYGFNYQGTFLNTGVQTFTVPAQGNPVAANQTPGDAVTFSASGCEVNCTDCKIPVLPPTAIFSITCGGAKFNGVYVKGTALTSSNTVTLPVSVTDISTGASWSVSTNTVNGISFSGSGMFPYTGSQTITLKGTGTPVGTDPITLTFTTNSHDGAATCTATLNPAIPPMTVLALGTANGYGYPIFAPTGTDAYRMVMDSKNFGTQPNSTVQFGDGVATWKIHSATGATTPTTAVLSALSGANPPDIVVVTYNFQDDGAGSLATALKTYLEKGGVVLFFVEKDNQGATLGNMMKALFGSGATVANNGGGGGTRYQFAAMKNDPIINGPFGDLSNQFWGEDASTTGTVTNIPTDSIIPYTYSTVAASAGRLTAFRHNRLNFVWVGDGGFTSCAAPTATTICPFYVQQTSPYIPMAKPVQYGSGDGIYGAGPVSNSIFVANALAWALQQAMTNGINPH